VFDWATAGIRIAKPATSKAFSPRKFQKRKSLEIGIGAGHR
jgi:hypothetical protein